MSPKNKIKLNLLRNKLDKLDHQLLKTIKKRTSSNFTTALIKGVPVLDLCNLGCIVNKIYLNLRIKTNL